VKSTDGVDIGIEQDKRKIIAEGLGHLLADTYTLYLKTHNFHWNVTGPRFRELHLMFEEQYTELAIAVDEIAERIRTLGFPAPGTYTDFSRLSVIDDTPGVPSADEMIKTLTQNNEAVVLTARKVLLSAQDGEDESTASLIADRMVVHEKVAWMLRSSSSSD
jgi:starvation-inducible DNA-binding protein